MKVIILHHPEGGSLAVVNDTALLFNLDYTEVDPEDSKKLITGNPELQKDIQAIFRDIMAIHGFRVNAPGATDAL